MLLLSWIVLGDHCPFYLFLFIYFFYGRKNDACCGQFIWVLPIIIIKKKGRGSGVSALSLCSLDLGGKALLDYCI